MKRVFLIFLAAVVFPAFGEFRIWESTTGQSIEAEYVGERSGKIGLKKQNGSVIYVKASMLSAADREYAALRIKPRLSIEVDKEEKRVQDTNLMLAFNNKVTLTADILKRSPKPYNGELTATFIFIGDNERSQHETIVKKRAVPFKIGAPAKLTESASFASEKGSFLKSAHHVFEAYAIVITDPFGEVITYDAKPAGYGRHISKLLALEEGAEFDKNFQAVDLSSEKTARAEAAVPNTWLYIIERGDLGFPQKSPDGIVLRIQTRHDDAVATHYREPIILKKLAENKKKHSSINAVLNFKLTEGKIGVVGSNRQSRWLEMNDEEDHVLEIVSRGGDVSFTLDGTPAEDLEINEGTGHYTAWRLSVKVAKKSRLEITSLEYQD